MDIKKRVELYERVVKGARSTSNSHQTDILNMVIGNTDTLFYWHANELYKRMEMATRLYYYLEVFDQDAHYALSHFALKYEESFIMNFWFINTDKAFTADEFEDVCNIYSDTTDDLASVVVSLAQSICEYPSCCVEAYKDTLKDKGFEIGNWCTEKAYDSNLTRYILQLMNSDIKLKFGHMATRMIPCKPDCPEVQGEMQLLNEAYSYISNKNTLKINITESLRLIQEKRESKQAKSS